MKKTRLLPSLILIAVLLGACAPAVNQTEPSTLSGLPMPTISALVEPTVPASQPVIPTLDAATQVQATTEVLAATPIPVATSRGPDLEATDPTTVSLASGGLHFVEFFRFT